MPQIAHWVIGTVICSIMKMGQRDRSLLNCTLGQRDRRFPNAILGHPDGSLPKQKPHFLESAATVAQ